MRSRGRGGFTSDRRFQFVSSFLPDICYRCGESGHLAKDYDLQEDACYNQGTGDHIAKDYKEPKRELEQCSYNCGKPGHLACDCDHADELKCYSCGEFEHMQKDCTKVKCYRCGETGHISIDCSKTSEVPIVTAVVSHSVLHGNAQLRLRPNYFPLSLFLFLIDDYYFL